MDVPWKIAHNNRYPTDYLNPFFKELNKSASRGILDQDEFEGKRPTDTEFEKQHSRLYKDFSKNYRRKNNLTNKKGNDIMEKKKAYKKFFHGKNLRKNNTSKRPFKGPPLSFMDSYHSTTCHFSSRRKFDSNGNAYIDLDTADNKHHEDHFHIIINGDRQKGNPNLSKKQKREFKKAKKKRRFFK